MLWPVERKRGEKDRESDGGGGGWRSAAHCPPDVRKWMEGCLRGEDVVIESLMDTNMHK